MKIPKKISEHKKYIKKATKQLKDFIARQEKYIHGVSVEETMAKRDEMEAMKEVNGEMLFVIYVRKGDWKERKRLNQALKRLKLTGITGRVIVKEIAEEEEKKRDQLIETLDRYKIVKEYVIEIDREKGSRQKGAKRGGI